MAGRIDHDKYSCSPGRSGSYTFAPGLVILLFFVFFRTIVFLLEECHLFVLTDTII